MTEHRPPRALQRLLLGLLAGVLALSGCAGGDEAGEVDTAPAARRDAGAQPLLDLGALPDAAAVRYGPNYWSDERLAKLEAAKEAALRDLRATPSPSPSPLRSPAPAASPTPTPSPTSQEPSPTQEQPPPEPTEPTEPPEPEEPTEPTEPEEGPVTFTSWGCQWSPDGDGLRGAACSGAFGEGDASEWSCFETRAWDDPDGGEQHCSGHVAGLDLAWTCTWEDGSVCASDDAAVSWSCTWGGSWGECDSDDPDDGSEPEDWFCVDLRDPSEGNWFVCDGAVNDSLPMSALALTGLWPLPG